MNIFHLKNLIAKKLLVVSSNTDRRLFSCYIFQAKFNKYVLIYYYGQITNLNDIIVGINYGIPCMYVTFGACILVSFNDQVNNVFINCHFLMNLQKV